LQKLINRWQEAQLVLINAHKKAPACDHPKPIASTLGNRI